MSVQAKLATSLRNLHIPGRPIILTNIYDAVSARAVAPLPGTQALATASFAVAAAAGFKDDEMPLETNLAAVRAIAPIAKEYGLPLSVDLQDGYGSRLEEAIEKILQLGVVGINMEDCDKEAKKMYPVDEAAERIKRVLGVAKRNGIDDFVVNARTDTLFHGGSISEAIVRGKSYLAAGATTAFVWGSASRGGITRDEVVELTKALDGRLNISYRFDSVDLTVKKLSEIGVARISVGPQLQLIAMKKLAEEAEKLLQSRGST